MLICVPTGKLVLLSLLREPYRPLARSRSGKTGVLELAAYRPVRAPVNGARGSVCALLDIVFDRVVTCRQ